MKDKYDGTLLEYLENLHESVKGDLDYSWWKRKFVRS